MLSGGNQEVHTDIELEEPVESSLGQEDVSIEDSVMVKLQEKQLPERLNETKVVT